MPAKSNPLFISIKDSARERAVSDWTIKDELRRGLLRARKDGRRTLIEYASHIERAESLPKAEFAPSKSRVLPLLMMVKLS